MSHHKADIIFAGSLIDTDSVLFFQRNRLFAEHMDAPVHRLNCSVRMQISRQTYIQNIYMLLIQHFVQICIFFHTVVFFHLLRTDITNRCKFCLVHLLPAWNMCAAYTTHAGNCNL